MKLILVAISLLAPSLACASGELLPPDNSMPYHVYEELGVPSVESQWNSTQYETALGVLELIAEKDVTQLPRYNSKKSGALFHKLLELKDLPGVTLTGEPEAGRTQRRIQSMLKLYLHGMKQNYWFGMEFANLFSLAFENNAELISEITKVMNAIEEDDPTYHTRVAGLQYMKNGMFTQYDGVLMILSDPTLPARERQIFISAIEEYGGTVFHFMTDQQQEAVRLHAFKIMKISDEHDKNILKRIITRSE